MLETIVTATASARLSEGRYTIRPKYSPIRLGSSIENDKPDKVARNEVNSEIGTIDRSAIFHL
ncbi:MAG: hypothetical protein ACO3EG_07585, partial [Chitinophagaceae bacterium]